MLSDFSSAKRNIEILSELTGINIEITQNQNISCKRSGCGISYNLEPYCITGYVFLCKCGLLYLCIKTNDFIVIIEPVMLKNLLSITKQDSVFRRINLYQLLKSLFEQGSQNYLEYSKPVEFLELLIGQHGNNHEMIKSALGEMFLNIAKQNNKSRELITKVVEDVFDAKTISDFYDAVKHFTIAYSDSSLKTTKQTKTDTIELLLNYINRNYCENITLESLSKKVFVSKTYLSRIFTEVTGTNFLQYLNELRIEKSKYLLAKTDMSISAIASKVGYTCSGYYTKMFKRITRMTPSEYRASSERTLANVDL